MSQKNSIFYNFLFGAYIYIGLQKLMSATYVRKNFVKNHIKEGYNIMDVRSGPSSILSDLPEINYYGYDINSSHIEYGGEYPNKNFISRFLIKNDKDDNIRSLDQYKKILNKYFCKIKCQVNNQKFIPCTWLKITFHI